MTNASLGWTQDQEIECAKCGKITKFKSVNFAEVCGDVRLNFVKIASCDSETCPHCGSEMEVNASWWQREFSYKAEDGRDIIRIVPLWFEDRCEGCSVDDLSRTTDYISNTYDFEDLRFDFAGVMEVIELLYERTKDEALLSIKEKLKENSGDESIEAMVPELKRIIDSHDDVLKDPYMPKI